MTSVGRGAHTPPQVRAANRQRAATYVGGGVPDAPEAFCRRPPPGRACPAPTARRWASPMPSVNAHGGVKTPPYERPISAYVNYILRAGCPHPAASSRGHPSTGSHPRRGRRPRRPGNLLPPPIPGKTPGPGMPGPYRAAVRERRQKNRGDPFSRDCLGSLYKHISA